LPDSRLVKGLKNFSCELFVHKDIIKNEDYVNSINLEHYGKNKTNLTYTDKNIYFRVQIKDVKQILFSLV